ncbi:MAG TPA: GTP cyclohydrolase II [Candidatus Limnocylindria bacterium]|nr:GTP cyclohydrolase II [Candidatus Limnocylindria bacterium]
MAITTLEQLLDESRDHDCPDPHCVAMSALADLPTRFGHFSIVAFAERGGAERDGPEHAALLKGQPWDREDVPVRLHSECLTGDAIGSLRCDCRDQLEASLRFIGEQEHGIVLYLRQEGRGIGLVNKIRAYALQDDGLDTVEANQALGFRDDERDYGVAAHILRLLRVRSVRIITNNPRKVAGLEQHGIRITGRIPLVVPPNEHNVFYLSTKARRSGHYIDLAGYEHLPEQLDRPIVNGMSAAAIAALEGAEDAVEAEEAENGAA